VIDLQPFCETEKLGRYKLDAPWIKGSVRYATDARICLAIPAPGEPDSGDGMYPNLTAVILRPGPDLLLVWPTEPKTRRGPVVCESCGSEIMADDGIIELGPGIIITRKYYRLVTGLPGKKGWYQPKPSEPIYFCFDGGEGAVMPMKDKDP